MSDLGNITWPLLVLGAGYYFRNEIKAALARVTEFGPAGVKLTAQAASQQAVAAPVATSPNELIRGIRELIPADQLEPAVRQINNELERVGGSATEQIDTLSHALAAVNIQLGHERNYRLIFGSQIEALIAMNGPAGASEPTLQTIFSKAVGQYPEFYKTFSYENWVRYLVASGLATKTATGLEITSYGRGFIKYVLDLHLPVQKLW